MIVAYAPDAPKELQYSVTDVNRKLPMTLLAGIFAVAVVVVGRMRGVMALVALAVSFLILTFFILPAILQGSNPLVVAVVGASAIMLIALYMCHGLSARTSVAVLGTLLSLLLIGLLGSLFIDWAALTGNTDDNTGLIHGLYPSIDMSGLLLAGIIIGSLGVLDDVTVTQTSAVWELHEANPTMGWRGLYRAGIRIGRDHIASVVNTLVLAYAGAALPLLLLFSIAQSSVGTVANSELVAEEIVRTLVGSIGLVASVPVTTALAALVVSADRPGSTGAPAPEQPTAARLSPSRAPGRLCAAGAAVAASTEAGLSGPGSTRAREALRLGPATSVPRVEALRPPVGPRRPVRVLHPALCSSARMRSSASSRCVSKSARERSWPSGTSLSVRSRKASSGAVADSGTAPGRRPPEAGSAHRRTPRCRRERCAHRRPRTAGPPRRSAAPGRRPRSPGRHRAGGRSAARRRDHRSRSAAPPGCGRRAPPRRRSSS